VVLAVAAADRPDPSWQARLGPKVEAAARAFTGALSLFVEDVATGQTYGYDATTPTYLSSAIKVVVAVEVLSEVDEGKLSLDQEVELGPDNVIDGVGPLRQVAPGTTFTVAQLLKLMLASSDNSAADALIRLVGVDALREQLARRHIQFGLFESLLGERRDIYAKLDPAARELTGPQVHELGRFDDLDARARRFSQMMGHSPPWTGRDLERAFRAFYEDRVNSASVAEMGTLLAQVAQCTGLSTESCQRLHALMRACKTGAHRVRAGLPPDIPWGHKTGTQFARACDLGIAWLSPEHPVVIAVCAREFPTVKDAEALFARMGRLAWETLGAKQPPQSTGGEPVPAAGLHPESADVGLEPKGDP
jgi:beta-lactamase class A